MTDRDEVQLEQGFQKFRGFWAWNSWTALGWSHIGCMASTMRPHTRRSESAVSWLE